MESWVSLFLAEKLGQMACRDPFQLEGFCVSMPSVSWWFPQALGRARKDTLPHCPAAGCWRLNTPRCLGAPLVIAGKWNVLL